MQAAGAVALRRGGAAWGAVRAGALRFERVRPVWILAPLVVVQWAAALALALSVPHNGWLYFHGGDATEYWAHEWALGHGWLPQTVLGYAVPILYAWIPRVLGPTLLTGLPAIVLVQVLLLGPLALAAFYGIASRLAGRLFAAFAAVLWVVAPFAVIPLWRADYHDRYVDLFLPQAFGLVNLGDYPSLVVVLVGSYLVFRTIDDGRGNDAVLAGLLFGLAIGVKPANALVVGAPIVALALARRRQSLVLFCVALVPALVTLALWKQRGLGHLPILTLPEVREAAATTIPGLPKLGHYLHFSREQLDSNLAYLREFFWSRWLLEYLPIAGAFAAFRASTAKGFYLVAWFVSIVIVKGGSSAAAVSSTSFFRLTMPGFPAFLLLAACVVLLVPRWGRRLRAARPPETWPRPSRGLVVALALLAALPFAVVASAKLAPRGTLARNYNTVIETPISDSLKISFQRVPDGVKLHWRKPRTDGSEVFYLVYRLQEPYGDGCTYPDGRGAQECSLFMELLGRTAIQEFEDTPLPGRYIYRVALAAAPVGDADAGDMILLSPPAPARIECTTAACERNVKKLRAGAG